MTTRGIFIQMAMWCASIAVSNWTGHHIARIIVNLTQGVAVRPTTIRRMPAMAVIQKKSDNDPAEYPFKERKAR